MPFPKKAVLTCAMICLLPACGTLPHESEQDDAQEIGLDEPFDVSQYVSGDSVEVFSLDAPVAPPPAQTPAQMPAQGVTGYGEGVISSHDASVTVYPLSSETAGGGRPSLMPPSGIRPYQSPFPAPDERATSWQDPPGIESSSVFVNPSFAPINPPTVGLTGASSGESQAHIYFGHDSEALDAADRQLLLELAESLGASPGIVNIEGHASPRATAPDPEGRHVINLRVSLDRAFEVAQFLIRHGVPAESIRTIGMGDVRPAALTQGMGEEEADRRVEIYVTPQ